MHIITNTGSIMKLRSILSAIVLCSVASVVSQSVYAQDINVEKKLKGFDKVVEQVLKDWNVPGCGIGIVYKDQLVYARGFGYRDIEEELPVTPNTLFHIASNTKLFTSVAIGLLVEDGKLEWDKPVRKWAPQLEFYNNELNNSVTIRDMLAHRTGISRHDALWIRSDFSREELFQRIKYLEPTIPLRQGYIYNNLMYVAAGQIIEIIAGQTWEEYVQERIFNPLGMTNSVFDVPEMIKQPDFMRAYTEVRDTNILMRSPLYDSMQGLGSAGSIVSSINDMSNWVIAHIYKGKFRGEQVIPASVIRETMRPVNPTSSVPEKNFENLNIVYGMGRSTSSYKGHYLAQHGGSVGGIYSNVSIMPADSIGVIVFTNRISQLPSLITYTIYDLLLDLPETPWIERAYKTYTEGKQTGREARSKPDTVRVHGTSPSHALSDYAGRYEDAAYGTVTISYNDDGLRFNYNYADLPLFHYHYDCFVTPDDQFMGRWFVNFGTDAKGIVNELRISFDDKEVVFVRKADARLNDTDLIRKQ